MLGTALDGATYLGDGIYADFDGDKICLMTEDGHNIRKIYIDDGVMMSLRKYADSKFNFPSVFCPANCFLCDVENRLEVVLSGRCTLCGYNENNNPITA